MREEAVLGDALQNVLRPHSLSRDVLSHQTDPNTQRQINITWDNKEEEIKKEEDCFNIKDVQSNTATL